MSYKDTRFWQLLRKLKNNHLFKKHYKKALKMDPSCYEDYLTKRYEEMMNRQGYSSGSKLDLSNPITFTEKCQWIKLYDQDPRKPVYSDKYAVREHIKETIGEKYLVPLISINGKDHFENANEIDFNQLPNRFVLKCNHGSHMNIIVEDKNSLTNKQIRQYKKQLNKWLKINYVFYVALETQYQGIKPCIIIEQFLEPNKEICDFKFMYFSGKLQFYWINEFVYDDNLRTSTTFLSNCSLAPYNFDLGRKKPIQKQPLTNLLGEMMKLSKVLADDFKMVRVDFMLINRKIYFSELTFNSAAGYDAPRPIEYNKIIGDQLKIDLNKRNLTTTYRKQ